MAKPVEREVFGIVVVFKKQYMHGIPTANGMLLAQFAKHSRHITHEFTMYKPAQAKGAKNSIIFATSFGPEVVTGLALGSESREI